MHRREALAGAAAARIDALLARMTIEEKAGQLSCFTDEVRPVDAVFNPVGPAVADILFGRREPTAWLPVSFPVACGQEPWAYDHPSTGRPAPVDAPLALGFAHWRDAPDQALFPFGSGEGYTRFTLADLTVTPRIAPGGVVRIRATLANVGARAGEALVCAYVHQIVASRARPVRQLKAFARAVLAAGERRPVELAVPHAALAMVGADGQWRVEPGRFDLRLSAGEGTERAARFDAVTAT